MILDATTKSIEIDLAEAHTTNAMTVTVDYVDLTTTTTTAGSSDTASNGTTAVTIVAAPDASTQRKVNFISVYNEDTVSHVTTIQLNNNTTLRTITKVTLAAGETLQYTDVAGWALVTSAGVYALLAGSSSQAFSTAALTTAGLFDISGPSAGQIKFPATQNASADANTLDDYEEGTFTPAYVLSTPGTSSFGTYTQQLGKYTKFGNCVVAQADIIAGTFSLGTGSGSLNISGYPFACNGTYPGDAFISYAGSYTTVGPTSARMPVTGTLITLYSAAATYAAITSANCATAMRTEVTVIYFV